jgi:hypothetical protein
MPRFTPILFALCFLSISAFSQAVKTNSPYGPNVFVFTPQTPAAEIQSRINSVYAQQQHAEFSANRYAFLFLPGEYHVDVPIGFYTQVLGLGETPDATHITGNVHIDAASPSNNATTTFWRSAEGLSVTPTVPPMRWAVSQAVSLRRMHIRGDMVLNQDHGWASGGWIADSLIGGTVDSGTQQQWISRNTDWSAWKGSNWNMVFVGVNRPPAGEWPSPPYTKIAVTPVVREKPFLEVDKVGHWSLRIPAIRRNSTGISWANVSSNNGSSIPLSHFYIAHPDSDTAATINQQLAAGKQLLLTPGIYRLSEPIRVTHKDTAIFGLGFATLLPTSGTAAMQVADVDGVTVSGILFDAGPQLSPVLLEVGTPGSHLSHAANPISLHDVFFRVGGAALGQTVSNLIINADDTLVDHTWIWRADHGTGVGWTQNLSANGLTVNGNSVTIYGLFVEHHQQYQVLWNGEHGRTYFYQSEIPYDPPNQPSWRSSPTTNGWASYKVADTVQSHEAWGLGVYSVFRHPGVTLSSAIETPVHPGIHFHHMTAIALDTLGEITHIIDTTGAAATPGPHHTPTVTEFP